MAIVKQGTGVALDVDELACGMDARGNRLVRAAERGVAPEGESDERTKRWRDRFAFPPLASFPARFIR